MTRLFPLLWSTVRGRSARRENHHDGRRGFTMVELVTVAVVIGTLVRINVPNFHELYLRARAADVAGDFEIVRVAALNYHADHIQWPKDGYTGQVPMGLEEYLPDGYQFDRPGYRLDWEHWVLPEGLPDDPGAGALLGVSMVTEDEELGQAVVDLLGSSMLHFRLGSKYTFIFERS